MARKQITVVISAEGRDRDKVFQITEKPARQVEDWAIRAFMGMARSGAEIPEDVKDAGFAGLITMGLKAIAGMHYADAKPLLDEMISCVKIIPDPANQNIIRALIDEDIEEVATFLQLRKEVFELHANFSAIVARLSSAETTAPQ